ncbi:MAG: hypothetical protein ABI462_03450 [Ignavibacteria bacterium]
MPLEIRTTDKFEKQAKRLFKKYPSLKKEISELGKILTKNPTAGTHLGKNFYKIRVAIKSKSSGKRGGARVITFLIYNKLSFKTIDRLYLVTIYDKSELESITDKELQKIISDIALSK